MTTLSSPDPLTASTFSPCPTEDLFACPDDLGYNWDELVRLAKDLERTIDGKLLVFSRQPNQADEAMAGLEDSLKSLGRVIEMMAELLDQVSGGDRGGPGKHVTSRHFLNRHRDIYQEYCKELRKIKVPDDPCLLPSQSQCRPRGQPRESRQNC